MQSATIPIFGPHDKPANVTLPILTYGPEAPFSNAARRKREQCAIDIKLVVTKEGTVRNAHIVKSCGKDFDPNALKTVKTYRFKPATKDSQPVDSVVMVQVGFTIY
ncbi:MAG TPA: energy transducer TonB [Acidobacteriaceae bacterium]